MLVFKPLSLHVNMPSMTTYIEAFLFDWDKIRSKYKKDTCLKEIGLHVQNIERFLSSKVT